MDHLVINCRTGESARVAAHERGDAEIELNQRADQAALDWEAAERVQRELDGRRTPTLAEKVAAALARDPQVIAAIAQAIGTETP